MVKVVSFAQCNYIGNSAATVKYLKKTVHTGQKQLFAPVIKCKQSRCQVAVYNLEQERLDDAATSYLR